MTPYKGWFPCSTCGQLHPADVKTCPNCQHRNPREITLDDWANGKPDAWDYESVLRDNDVTVEWYDEWYDEVTDGWYFYWTHGTSHIGQCSEKIARKAAALFVSLWLRNVSASFCNKLMDGFIMWLEFQENKQLTFLCEIESHEEGYLLLTREGLFNRESFNFDMEDRLVQALDPQPDEEIIVTFTKRKKDGR
jgi:hypothetical protein